MLSVDALATIFIGMTGLLLDSSLALMAVPAGPKGIELIGQIDAACPPKAVGEHVAGSSARSADGEPAPSHRRLRDDPKSVSRRVGAWWSSAGSARMAANRSSRPSQSAARVAR